MPRNMSVDANRTLGTGFPRQSVVVRSMAVAGATVKPRSQELGGREHLPKVLRFSMDINPGFIGINLENEVEEVDEMGE